MEIEKFDGDVEYIEELITRITNPYTREALQKKYVDLYYQAKKLPVERASSYPIFSAMVQNFVVDVIDQDEKTRQELGMIENLGFEPLPSEETEEEAKERNDKLAARKLEAYKKLKLKPKTEDEEAADLAALIEKASAALGEQLCNNPERVRSVERELNRIKTTWLMDNHTKMDADEYDAINRKLSIYDIELGAKDLVLRLDLDIPLSKFTAPPKVPDMVSATGKSVDGPVASAKGSKQDAKISDI